MICTQPILTYLLGQSSLLVSIFSGMPPTCDFNQQELTMLFDLTDNAGALRDRQILDHAKQGDLVVRWAPLTLGPITLQVTGDAIKLDGVRINVSANLLQRLADYYHAMLLTPKIADEMYLHKSIQLLPQIPGPPSSSTAIMKRHSALIDAALAGRTTDGIIDTVGKDWVVDNALLQHPGKGENMGWRFPGSAFGGSPWEPTVTPGLRAIQGRGWFHPPSHVDGSQTARLVRLACTVNGMPADLRDVLTNPSLAGFVNHDGVLKVLRQPGVPDDAAPYQPTSTTGAIQWVAPTSYASLPQAVKDRAQQLLGPLPLNTSVVEVYDGIPYKYAAETHTWYGANPDQPSAPHKGISVYVPKGDSHMPQQNDARLTLAPDAREVILIRVPRSNLTQVRAALNARSCKVRFINSKQGQSFQGWR